MKPTHLLILKTESDGDYLAINSQDLKTVTINLLKETAMIVTSSAKTNLACMTRHRTERLSKELGDRYNILHLPSMQCKTSDKDNTIILVEKDGTKIYIWPKALFTVMKRGQKLTLTAFGGMEIELEDLDNRVKVDDLVRFDGFVKI